MTNDQKILKKISNKIKKINTSDVSKIENELTRQNMGDLMSHMVVMLASAAAGPAEEETQENV